MNLQAVLARPFAPVVHRYTWRDAALYALSIGMAQDPLDAAELPYVYERYEAGRWGQLGRIGPAAPFRAVPSFCVTLAWLPFWQDEPDLAIHWRRIVHGELSFELHRPLAPEGHVRARHHIAAVQDKGGGRGALVHMDKVLVDAASDEPVATLRSVEFLRDDGGCGSWGESRATLPPLPAPFRATATMDCPTTRQAALVYRLASGDYMPIHADPDVAQAAGFERPISHGLNNLGIACRALLRHFAPGRPERLKGMAVRFVQPGLPGDTVRVEMMPSAEEPGLVHFRAHALERDVPLLDRGACRLRG